MTQIIAEKLVVTFLFCSVLEEVMEKYLLIAREKLFYSILNKQTNFGKMETVEKKYVRKAAYWLMWLIDFGVTQ